MQVESALNIYRNLEHLDILINFFEIELLVSYVPINGEITFQKSCTSVDVKKAMDDGRRSVIKDESKMLTNSSKTEVAFLLWSYALSK